MGKLARLDAEIEAFHKQMALAKARGQVMVDMHDELEEMWQARALYRRRVEWRLARWVTRNVKPVTDATDLRGAA